MTTLFPEKRVYDASGMPMTEAAIENMLTGDLYVSLGEPVDDGAWSVRVYHKPFVTWIWARLPHDGAGRIARAVRPPLSAREAARGRRCAAARRRKR